MNLLLFISIYKDSNSIKLPEQPMSALRQYHILSAAEHSSAAHRAETGVGDAHRHAESVGRDAPVVVHGIIVVEIAAALELLQQPPVLLIAGVDLDGFLRRVQRRDLVAHIHVCARVQIVPLAVPQAPERRRAR